MQSPRPRATIPVLGQLDLVIETERLRLRPFRRDDVEDLWPIVSDPAFPALMTWAAHTDRAQTEQFIDAAATALADGTAVRWAIEHDGRAIGCVGLEGVMWHAGALRVDRAELGYWIAPAHGRRGLMTEAADAVVRCGFHTIGLHKITVSCVAENTASRRVIEKLGFRPVGRSEDHVWRDGRWWSLLRYELTSPEWPDVHTTMKVSRPRPT